MDIFNIAFETSYSYLYVIRMFFKDIIGKNKNAIWKYFPNIMRADLAE